MEQKEDTGLVLSSLAVNFSPNPVRRGTAPV